MAERALVLIDGQRVEIGDAQDLCIGRAIVTLGTDQDLLVQPNGAGKVDLWTDGDSYLTVDSVFPFNPGTGGWTDSGVALKYPIFFTWDGYWAAIGVQTSPDTEYGTDFEVFSGGGGIASGGMAAGDGGYLYLYSGDGGIGGPNPDEYGGYGGDVSIRTGDGGSAAGGNSAGDSGYLDVYLGYGGDAGPNPGEYAGFGGDIDLWSGGGGSGSWPSMPGASAGSITLQCGYPGDGGFGGNITLNASPGGYGYDYGAGGGGYIHIHAGTGGGATSYPGSGSGVAGDIEITAGNGGDGAGAWAAQPGGHILLTAGNAGYASSSGSNGGYITIKGGQASGVYTGGLVSIVGGDASGLFGGTAGSVAIDVGVPGGGGSPGAINIGQTRDCQINLGRTGQYVQVYSRLQTNDYVTFADATKYVTFTARVNGTVYFRNTGSQIITVEPTVGSIPYSMILMGGSTSGVAGAGPVEILGGQGESGGHVYITSGNGTAGAAGSVMIDTGTKTTLDGGINIGTSRAGQINLGRSAGTVTVPAYAIFTNTLDVRSSLILLGDTSGDQLNIACAYIYLGSTTDHYFMVNASPSETVGRYIGLFAGSGGAAGVIAGGGTGGRIRNIAGQGGDGNASYYAGPGGAIEITAGNAGNDMGGVGRGNTGGALGLTAGNGTPCVSGTVGFGGAITITAGMGGSALAALATGRTGGAVTITSGHGGNASASMVGANGGALSIYSGEGGDAVGTPQGGDGGTMTIQAGAGGLGTASVNGRFGGAIFFKGGTGGAGIGAGRTSGTGGTLYIAGGQAGAIYTGATMGDGGDVYIDGGNGTNFGRIMIGTSFARYVQIDKPTYHRSSWAGRRDSSATDFTDTGISYYIGITNTAIARNVYLASASLVLSPIGRIIIVKDESGAAATNNITVWPNGADTIDGAASKAINTNYGWLMLISDGTSKWFVIGKG